MSKLVYVCLRRRQQTARAKKIIESIAARLRPDNLTPVPPRVFDLDGVVIGIYNPTGLERVSGRSVCVGYLVADAEWRQPLRGRPDGAYALFRADDRHVEILADALASRTIWYFKDDDMFVASTSQRALVPLLGGLNFNPGVIPWMLASGTLGPSHSWDRRIEHLGAATSVVLDRDAWTLARKTEPAQRAVLNESDGDHERRLRAALERVVGAAALDRAQWALPLSGGVDCRTILCLLREPAGLRAVTWGLRASLHEKDNDAYVARNLATHFDLNHEYHETDLSSEPVEDIFRRYLVCGEGRIDHISGYMDGFQIWKTLHDTGVRGIIRGDQVFGRKTVSSPSQVRASAGMPLWSDFDGLRRLEEFGISPQSVPEALARGPQETLEAWRDRLQQDYRVPFVLAALSDLKLPYVEIISPLLSGSLVNEIRKLPDHLRTNKKLLRTIVHCLSPEVGFAKYWAAEPATRILESPRIVDVLREYLSSSHAEVVVPREFTRYVLDGLAMRAGSRRPPGWRNLRRMAASYLPSWIMKRKTSQASALRPNLLAFRVYLMARMHDLLAEDAASLRAVE